MAWDGISPLIPFRKFFFFDEVLYARNHNSWGFPATVVLEGYEGLLDDRLVFYFPFI